MKEEEEDDTQGVGRECVSDWIARKKVVAFLRESEEIDPKDIPNVLREKFWQCAVILDTRLISSADAYEFLFGIGQGAVRYKDPKTFLKGVRYYLEDMDFFSGKANDVHEGLLDGYEYALKNPKEDCEIRTRIRLILNSPKSEQN